MFQFHHETFGHQPSLPLSDSIINLFVAYIEMKGLSRNTARTYLSMSGHPHRLAGLADPTSNFAAGKMLESVGKDCVFARP